MSDVAKPHLISFKICPFVQRSVIALKLKSVDYTLTHITPTDTPDWFKAISPLGKVPVLVVNDIPIFESAVILEYLDEVYAPRLHPADPLTKAQHRSWVEFNSELLSRQHRMLTAHDSAAFAEARTALTEGLERLESVLPAATPFFSGTRLHLVDCVYAPLFLRLDLLKREWGLDITLKPRLQTWSDALLAMEAIQTSVVPDFPAVFRNFLQAQGGHIPTIQDAQTPT